MDNQDKRGAKRGHSNDTAGLNAKRAANGTINSLQSLPRMSGWSAYPFTPQPSPSWSRLVAPSPISLNAVPVPSTLAILPSVTDVTVNPAPLCLVPDCEQSASTSGIDKGFCGSLHYLHAKYTILLELRSGQSKYQKAIDHFVSNWSYKKGTPPSANDIMAVFKIFNRDQKKAFKKYTKNLSDKTVEKHYHGTSVKCDLMKNKTPCADKTCGVCGISKRGFDKSLFATNIPWFTRFGKGFYLAPNSSKCHDYTQGIVDYRVMLLCKVAPGKKFTMYYDQRDLTAPPIGYDSVYGASGGSLNYPEIVLYRSEAILPIYAIIYRRDGIYQIAK